MANEKTPAVHAVNAEPVGPKVEVLTSKFKEQSIPLEVDFKNLIEIADVGRRAVGLSLDQLNNGPGNGIAVTDDGRLEVKAAPNGGLNVNSNGVSVDIHSILPAGMIMMFSGSTIPPGWAVCDGGTYGGTKTPNLVDKFILGGTLGSLGAQNSISLTGDKDNKVWAGVTDSKQPDVTVNICGHKLTENEMPSHQHLGGLVLNNTNALSPWEYGVESLGKDASSTDISGSIYGKNKLQVLTQKVGGGGAHSHDNTAEQKSHFHAISVSAPYYVLVFIIKVDG